MNNGVTYIEKVTEARGGPDNPMSDEELIKKLMTYSSGLDVDMTSIVDNIMNIDNELIFNDIFV